jgi:multiple sugar transport system ATP-binding protein
MKKLAREVIEARVKKAAELMHIDGLLKRYPSQLSGGQRQRVAVARALAMEPEVLLMDEPLSNLDALLRMEMRAELKALLKESRTTTIYVTHDQVEAMSLADRIAIMDQGRIVQVAAPIEIYRNPANRYIGSFIGSPPMNFLPAHRQDGAWDVAGLRMAGPSPGGNELVFGIRPEDVQLAESGFAAEVRVVEPLGAHQLITAHVGQHLFRVVLDSDVAVAPGGRLKVAPRPERVRWFDPQTGTALHSAAEAGT